jgi:hypothetical protein
LLPVFVLVQKQSNADGAGGGSNISSVISEPPDEARDRLAWVAIAIMQREKTRTTRPLEELAT